MKHVKPGKRFFSAFLALTMASALFCPTASAAQTPSIGLQEGYTLVGGKQDMQAHSAVEYVEESYWASPVVVDLDGDGKLEVINAAYSLTVADAATGKVKWQVNSGKDRSSSYALYTTGANAAGQVFCDFIVKDLDGDGFKEIVIGYSNGTVAVLDSWGYYKSGWPKAPGQDPSNANVKYSVRSLAVDDVDGDGKQEVIVGLGCTSEFPSIWVYGYDGAVKPGWPQRTAAVNGISASYSDGIYSNGITTGDLDGDGLPEIIMPTDNWFINAYNGDGSLVMASDAFGDNVPWCTVGMYEDSEEELARKNGGWGLTVQYESLAEKGRAGTYGPSLGSAVARYVDVDGDGTSEVVMSVLMMDRTDYFLVPQGTRDWAGPEDAKYMTVCILNQDRTRFNNGTYDWTNFPTNLTADLGGPVYLDQGSLSSGVESAPVVADLNGDGVNEILFNSFDGKVHCFSLDGKEHDNWPYKLPQNTSSVFEYATEPVCKDLDGDGKLEVIFASWTRNAAGTKTGVDGALYILDCNGSLITKYKLHESLYEAGSIKTDNGVYAAPTVADVDGDGKYEILVNTRHYGLCAYKATPGGTTVERPRAYANDMKISVNGGSPFVVHTYVLRDANGGDTNYVKIRDLAKTLYAYAWDLRFNVTWSEANGINLITGNDYQSVGGEWYLSFVGNQPYVQTNTTLKVNGKTVTLDTLILTDANGGDYTYCKLRDLGDALGTFNVGWKDDGTVAGLVLINKK